MNAERARTSTLMVTRTSTYVYCVCTRFHETNLFSRVTQLPVQPHGSNNCKFDVSCLNQLTFLPVILCFHVISSSIRRTTGGSVPRSKCDKAVDWLLTGCVSYEHRLWRFLFKMLEVVCLPKQTFTLSVCYVTTSPRGAPDLPR